MKLKPIALKMSKILHSIIAILCIVEFTATDAEINVKSKTLTFPEKEVHFGFESYKNGKLTYLTCDQHEGSNERKCKIIREKSPLSDDTYSCDITLKLDHRQGNTTSDTDRISPIPFGKNRAIIYQAEKGKFADVKISTVNLDDCKVQENEISVKNIEENPIHAVIITPYEDNCDIFYKSSINCGNDENCKLTIDSTGKIIDGPASTKQNPASFAYYPFVTAVDSKSRDKGTFSVEDDSSQMHFVLHKPDGTKKTLGSYRILIPIVKSSSNNFIGVCYKENPSKINCIQYDEVGNVKFELDQIRNHNTTNVGLLYNLPGGGLLILAEKCEKLYCDMTEMQFMVLKIDSAGKQVGKLNIGNVKFEAGTQVIRVANSFYTDSNNNYCLSFVNYHSTEIEVNVNGRIESNSRCFKDEDFAK